MSGKSRSLLVFDMDGVLVDVTPSYRETTRRTARMFFSIARGASLLPDPLFSLEELAEVKRRGGLNNDWDLTFRIISVLMKKVERPPDAPLSGADPWDAFCAEVSQWNVIQLAEFLGSCRKGLVHLWDSVEGDDQGVEAFYRGDVGEGNVIKRIFQELYLGGRLFRALYRVPPRVYSGEGLISRERPLVTAETLSGLHSEYFTAVATGRPRSEAELALDSHGFGGFFDFMFTLDECQEEERVRALASGSAESLSKPDPFMLDAIAAGLSERPERAYYVGDMPDDMAAALRSGYGYVPVGVTGRGPEARAAARALLDAGARLLVEDVEELSRVLRISS